MVMRANTDAARARTEGFDFDLVTEDGRWREVLDELCEVNEATFQRRGRVVLPSRPVVAELIEDLRAVLYPEHFGSPDGFGRSLHYRIAVRLDKARQALEGQVRRGLELMCEHGAGGTSTFTRGRASARASSSITAPAW
jgi:hypothetical protein